MDPVLPVMLIFVQVALEDQLSIVRPECLQDSFVVHHQPRWLTVASHAAALIEGRPQGDV